MDSNSDAVRNGWCWRSTINVLEYKASTKAQILPDVQCLLIERIHHGNTAATDHCEFGQRHTYRGIRACKATFQRIIAALTTFLTSGNRLGVVDQLAATQPADLPARELLESSHTSGSRAHYASRWLVRCKQMPTIPTHKVKASCVPAHLVPSAEKCIVDAVQQVGALQSSVVHGRDSG